MEHPASTRSSYRGNPIRGSQGSGTPSEHGTASGAQTVVTQSMLESKLEANNNTLIRQLIAMRRKTDEPTSPRFEDDELRWDDELIAMRRKTDEPTSPVLKMTKCDGMTKMNHPQERINSRFSDLRLLNRLRFLTESIAISRPRAHGYGTSKKPYTHANGPTRKRDDASVCTRPGLSRNGYRSWKLPKSEHGSNCDEAS